MPTPLPAEVRRGLLALARRAHEAGLGEVRLLVKGEDYKEVAPEPRGAFVTLTTRAGALRGWLVQAAGTRAVAGGVVAHETRRLDVVLPPGGVVKIALTAPFQP